LSISYQLTPVAWYGRHGPTCATSASYAGDSEFSILLSPCL